MSEEIKETKPSISVSLGDNGGIDLNSGFDPIETIVVLQTAIEVVRHQIIQQSQSRLITPAKGRIQ